jgi:antitoxin VapB
MTERVWFCGAAFSSRVTRGLVPRVHQDRGDRTGVTMAISLKDPETDRLAQEVAALTGQTLTEAIRAALVERLDRERRRRVPGRAGLAQRLKALGEDCAALPDLDARSADGIIGYDELGVPR